MLLRRPKDYYAKEEKYDSMPHVFLHNFPSLPDWCNPEIRVAGRLYEHIPNSRRINIQHRLVYQVIAESNTVKVLRMWTQLVRRHGKKIYYKPDDIGKAATAGHTVFSHPRKISIISIKLWGKSVTMQP